MGTMQDPALDAVKQENDPAAGKNRKNGSFLAGDTARGLRDLYFGLTAAGLALAGTATAESPKSEAAGNQFAALHHKARASQHGQQLRHRVSEMGHAIEAQQVTTKPVVATPAVANQTSQENAVAVVPGLPTSVTWVQTPTTEADFSPAVREAALTRGIGKVARVTGSWAFQDPNYNRQASPVQVVGDALIVSGLGGIRLTEVRGIVFPREVQFPAAFSDEQGDVGQPQQATWTGVITGSINDWLTPEQQQTPPFANKVAWFNPLGITDAANGVRYEAVEVPGSGGAASTYIAKFTILEEAGASVTVTDGSFIISVGTGIVEEGHDTAGALMGVPYTPASGIESLRNQGGEGVGPLLEHDQPRSIAAKWEIDVVPKSEADMNDMAGIPIQWTTITPDTEQFETRNVPLHITLGDGTLHLETDPLPLSHTVTFYEQSDLLGANRRGLSYPAESSQAQTSSGIAPVAPPQDKRWKLDVPIPEGSEQKYFIAVDKFPKSAQ